MAAMRMCKTEINRSRELIKFKERELNNSQQHCDIFKIGKRKVQKMTKRMDGYLFSTKANLDKGITELECSLGMWSQ